MVFIHPRILRDDADVAENTGRYYKNMRNSQESFNQNELNDYLRIDKSAPQLDPWDGNSGNTKPVAVPKPAVQQPAATQMQ